MGGGVCRRSKSTSHRHDQLQLGLPKQKHKDRQAILSRLDTPAKPSRTLVAHSTILLFCTLPVAHSTCLLY